MNLVVSHLIPFFFYLKLPKYVTENGFFEPFFVGKKIPDVLMMIWLTSNNYYYYCYYYLLVAVFVSENSFLLPELCSFFCIKNGFYLCFFFFWSCRRCPGKWYNLLMYHLFVCLFGGWSVFGWYMINQVWFTPSGQAKVVESARARNRDWEMDR